jgi:hypothetical protein
MIVLEVQVSVCYEDKVGIGQKKKRSESKSWVCSEEKLDEIIAMLEYCS